MSRDNVIKIQLGLHNEYKLEAAKVDPAGREVEGSRRALTGWFHNLITNIGMDRFGVDQAGSQNSPSTQWARGCRVGSGSATPQFTDTNLQSIVASTATKLSITYSRNLAATPAYVERTIVYRFGTGVAAGNLTEVGLVCATTDSTGTNGALNNTTPCSTRALILDGEGNPTTVTVLSDEILDVTCRQRLYVPGDVIGTITPAGGVAGAINYVIRPCEIDQGQVVNQGGWGGSSTDTGWDFKYRYSSGFGECAAFVGASSAIGAVDGSPTGTKASAGSNGMQDISYAPGTFYRDIKNSFGLGTANTGINDPNGIGAHMLSFGACSFQIGFTPRMVKTADMLYDITLRLTWARYTP